MPDTDAIGDAIDNLAANPAEIESDGLKVKERPLTELIEASKYRKANAAAANARRGIRVTKFVPPGAV